MRFGGTLRLFVFPHAGGSQLMFNEWARLFPAGWRLLPQDYPGHGLLAGEPPIGDADTLVDWFLDRLSAELDDPDVPFACFGHSMGSLIAFELTRRLVDEGRRPPVWLGLSGCGAPRPGRPAEEPGELTDAELRRKLIRLGGTPPRILDNPELWSIFAPVIRADISLVRNWRPPHDVTPLPVPLTVFHGEQDTTAPAGPLEQWAESTHHFLGVRRFEGGHFYFQDDPAALADAITADVRAGLEALAGTP
ncbi:thioesterase II family protein [Streptomyces sp. NPDC001933]|uniref:thioesterase II family protein n=1 Tax=Streptomyces sp. NPDC001933 TaxID=3364626 RepID=UPI0036A97C6A